MLRSLPDIVLSIIVFCSMQLVCFCGPKSENGPPSNLQIRLLLPEVLAKDSPRFQRFVRRALFLRMTVSSGKDETVYVFAPEQWESIFLKPLVFGEAIHFSTEVWDRKPNGIDRSYPVLEGKQSVTAKETTRGKPFTVGIRLHLRVSEKEYD